MNSYLRVLIALGAGLFIGVVASTLFIDSLPPAEGTAQAQVYQLKREIVRSKSQIASLEARLPKREPTLEERSRETTARIFDDLKNGRPVDLNVLYGHVRPVLRDLSPLFNNMRRREERKEHARIAAHMGEAYQLNTAQQEALKQWLGERAIQDGEAFRATVYGENATFEDFIRASKYQRPDNALDEFMERTLTGTTKERFVSDRLRERAQRVENVANNRVNLVSAAVQLDPAQQDRVFAIMARSSPEFDPRMKFDGLGSDISTIRPGSDREQAIRNVLRPDQLTRYNAYRQKQWEEASREATEIGLSLPKNWDLFDD